MAQVTISLPDDLSAWAESRVTDGSYGDPAEYVRDLVRRDRDPFEYLAELRAGLRTAGGSADAA